MSESLSMFDDRVFRVDHIIPRMRPALAHAAAKIEIHGRSACEQEREQDEEPDQHHGQQGDSYRSRCQQSHQNGQNAT